MPVDRTIRLWSMAALLVSALAVSGCSTSIADLPGLGGDGSARPKEANGYLPVHDLPPERNEAVIKPAEQAKIQADLAAARDRTAAAAATPNPAAK
jgi:hypothetical protein